MVLFARLMVQDWMVLSPHPFPPCTAASGGWALALPLALGVPSLGGPTFLLGTLFGGLRCVGEVLGGPEDVGG